MQRKNDKIMLRATEQSEAQKCTFEPQINQTSQLLAEMQSQLVEMGIETNRGNKAHQRQQSEI